MNRRIAALLVGLSLLLTGCGSGTEKSTPAPTVTVTAEAVKPQAPQHVPETQQRMTDREFVSFVRQTFPELYKDSDASIVSLAKTVCSAYDRGVETRQILQTILDGVGTFEYKQALAGLVGAAVPAYCPEHMSKTDRSPAT